MPWPLSVARSEERIVSRGRGPGAGRGARREVAGRGEGGRRGDAALAEPRRAGGYARVPRARREGVSRPRGGADLAADAAGVPEGHGRLARGRGPRRLPLAQGDDPAVRQPAGGPHPRRAAAVRDRDGTRRCGRRPAGHELRRAAGEGGGQPVAPGEPGRGRRLRAGEPARAVRSGPQPSRWSVATATRCSRRAGTSSRRLPGRTSPRCAPRKAPAWPSSPRRARRRASPGCGSASRSSCPRRSGSPGSRSPVTTAAARRRGRSASRCGRCCASTGRTWSFASTPIRSPITPTPWRTRGRSHPAAAVRAAR